MNKPNFLILGAAKAGTTTLYRVLDAHPDIALSQPKEPLFFEKEYERGLEYYWQTYFAHWKGERAVGDARASSLCLPYVAGRIGASLPEVKLIAILRNPVDRAYSHWWMHKSGGTQALDFEAAVEGNLRAREQGSTLEGERGKQIWLDYLASDRTHFPCYLEIGFYAQQLRTYLNLFPASQLKVIFFDDLVQQPARLYTEVLEFLGVASDVLLPIHERFNAAPNRMGVILHRLDRFFNVPPQIPESTRRKIRSAVGLLGKPPQVTPSTRKWLSEFYAPHNRELEGMTGRDLRDWG